MALQYNFTNSGLDTPLERDRPCGGAGWYRTHLHSRDRFLPGSISALKRPARRRRTRPPHPRQQEQAAQEHGGVQAGLVGERPQPDLGGRAPAGARAEKGFGSLLVPIATNMSMTSGIAAKRVTSPPRGGGPQTISTTPTKFAMIFGGRDAELDEPAGALIGVEELDQARGEEHGPDGQADQDRCRGRDRPRVTAIVITFALSSILSLRIVARLVSDHSRFTTVPSLSTIAPQRGQAGPLFQHDLFEGLIKTL